MSRRAFSLVETLIAMAILSIALVGLAAVPVATTRLMVHGVQREKALSVAMARLEEVEGVDLDNTSWVVSSDVDGGYSWSRSVAKTSDYLHSVTVVVDWDGLRGAGSLTLSRDYGPFSAREASK
nr:prepilin-type N-terminal cleavage/methylation domain-containing protein [uncultured Dethiosulfovibrio sp.]